MKGDEGGCARRISGATMRMFGGARRGPIAVCALAIQIGAAGGALAQAPAEAFAVGATYVCNGEHIYVENCNIRDLSDSANCMVAHPDHLNANGMNTYTYVTRGALKKLLPTCTQPSAKQAAAAKTFQQKQQDLYNANVQKANNQMNAPAPGQGQGAGQQGSLAQVQPPKNAEERAMRRCVSSGRLAASCTGNSLLGAFGQMLGSVLPGANKAPAAGPVMAGVFQGADNWRLDFIDGGVLVNCAFLSPNQESYKVEFRSTGPTLVIDTRPKPLVLSIKGDSLVGPGPVTIEGVVAAGYVSGAAGTGATQKDQYGNLYDGAGNRVAGNANNGYTRFAPKTATCPALNLSSKGAGTGIQTMQTDLLKTMFGGDKGPPTPAGIRMQGIFAAPTGFSVQFFPESVILGCGPDAARAYPYTVVAEGNRGVVKVDAPDHPLALTIRPDGSLDPEGSGPYQVHGRIVIGQDDNDDFTFAPMETTCNLGVMAVSATIPSGGGVAATAMAGGGGAGGSGGGAAAGGVSTPQAPLGNAVLTVVSGLPTQPGMPNALAGRPFLLMRNSYADDEARAGFPAPEGTSPYKYVGTVCSSNQENCQKILAVIRADAISAVRADASGSGTLPGVPAGTYYLMISAVYSKQSLVWGQAVTVHAGQNSVTLDLRNATPVN